MVNDKGIDHGASCTHPHTENLLALLLSLIPVLLLVACALVVPLAVGKYGKAKKEPSQDMVFVDE